MNIDLPSQSYPGAYINALEDEMITTAIASEGLYLNQRPSSQSSPSAGLCSAQRMWWRGSSLRGPGREEISVSEPNSSATASGLQWQWPPADCAIAGWPDAASEPVQQLGGAAQKCDILTACLACDTTDVPVDANL